MTSTWLRASLRPVHRHWTLSRRPDRLSAGARVFASCVPPRLSALSATVMSTRTDGMRSVPCGARRLSIMAKRFKRLRGSKNAKRVDEAQRKLLRDVFQEDDRGTPGAGDGEEPQNFVGERRVAEKAAPELEPFRPTPAPPEVRNYTARKQFAQPANARICDVAILGTPNAGKSMLVNCLTNTVVSAVSPKRHTTRRRTLGVSTIENVQAILLDTPGIIAQKDVKQFIRTMGQEAWKTAMQADVMLVMIDAAKGLTPVERMLLARIPEIQERKPELAVSVALNKVDRVHPKRKLLQLSDQVNDMCDFEETFMISCTDNVGIGEIRDYIVEKSVPGEWQFADDETTDLSPLERLYEVIREKLYCRLNQEIPYELMQNNIGWTQLRDGSLRIDHEIVVPRKSQIHVVVGMGAATISAVRLAAQRDLERMFNCKVHLYLRVKHGAKRSLYYSDEV